MAVHHVEQMMGVPYRYVKEFIHPVLREGRIVYEPFYLFVRYLDCNAVMDLDNKVYPNFIKNGYKIKKETLGRGYVYSYSMSEFCLSAVELLTHDLYGCLESEPLIKPYHK
jgi:aminoglycoside 3-N-acetyltransferase